MGGYIHKQFVTLVLIISALTLSGVPVRAQTEPTTITVGTLMTTGAGDFINLEPRTAIDSLSMTVLDALYIGLTRLERQADGTETAVLALAETHEIDPQNPNIHYFTVRADAKYNDGTPITIQTFADAITRTRRYGSVADESLIDTASVENDRLRIYFKNPTSIEYARVIMALSMARPVDLRVYGEDDNATGEGAVGNGPYQLESVESDQVVLVRDPGYTGTPAAVERVVFRRYLFPAALRNAIRDGQVDVAWNGLPSDYYNTALQQAGVTQQQFPSMVSSYLIFGLDLLPFDNVIARRGLAHFIDRPFALRDSYGDTANPLLRLVPPVVPSPGEQTYPAYNEAQGREVLQTGGFSDFRQLQGQLTYSAFGGGDLHTEAVGALGSRLRTQRILQIQAANLELVTYYEQFERPTFQSTVLIGLNVIVPHVDFYLWQFGSPDGAFAEFARYNNPQIEPLLEELAVVPAERANAIRAQILDILIADMPYIPLWQVDQVIYTRTGVGGIVLTPRSTLDLTTLTKQG